MYIVFEGPVGTGKTTQSKKLADWLQNQFPGIPVVWTREPGGSEIADTVRAAVQGTQYSEVMDPVCEAYLYAASRAQTLRTIVLPCLRSGGIVVADRSFITSLAYQGFARRLGLETVWGINKLAVDNIFPDLVIYLDMSVEAALARAHDQIGDKFEYEGASFFSEVRRGYEIISGIPLFEKKWVTVSAEGDPDCVFAAVLQAIQPKIKMPA